MAALSQASAREALVSVIDPEVGINIVDLGLVYRIEVHDGHVEIDMTMTSPACPLGAHLKESATRAIHRAWPEVKSVQVRLVWEPPWSPDKMSPRARAQLGHPGMA
jgi:metal-sulfur cluster biosynthetic enzyme